MIRGGPLLSVAVAGALAIGLSWKASAQMQSGTREPEPRHGAVIAAQGTASGAPACAQCHAFNGVSDGSGAFPRIAGQSAYYLAKQLRDFASGIRVNAIMTPIVSALTADDITDVAAYYAGIETLFLPLRRAEPALIKQGEELAKIGSAASRVQACDNCHGAGGAGEPPAIPYLAGQYASDIALEWRMWRRGFRKSSPGAMACLAEYLNDQEIAAAAAYYEQDRTAIEAAASHASTSQ
jgi:cytochrome c553